MDKHVIGWGNSSSSWLCRWRRLPLKSMDNIGYHPSISLVPTTHRQKPDSPLKPAHCITNSQQLRKCNHAMGRKSWTAPKMQFFYNVLIFKTRLRAPTSINYIPSHADI